MRGSLFYSDILGLSHLGEHFSPITAAFVPLYVLWPSALWLFLVQGAAVAILYVQLYRQTLREFQDFPLNPQYPALLIWLMAMVYYPLTAALAFDFHPSTIVVPVLFVAIMAVRQRHWPTLALAVAILLLAKENGTLAVLGLGFVALAVNGDRRAFAILAITAALAAAFIFLWFMPQFQPAGWTHYGRLGPLDDLFGKSVYIVYRLLFVVLFLPLIGWRYAIGAVPLVALNVSVSYPAQYSAYFHYDDLGSVFFLVATLFGLKSVLQFVNRNWSRRGVLLVLIGAAGIEVVIGLLGGAVLTRIAESPPTVARLERFSELMTLAALPSDQRIVATGDLATYLGNRDDYVRIVAPNPGDLGAVLKDGDIVVLDNRMPERNIFVKDILRTRTNSVRTMVSDNFEVYRVER